MITKKLIKHGRSLALIIDKPLLEALNFNEETELELSIEDGKLIVAPVKKGKTKKLSAKHEKIKKTGREVMREYEDVFKKLSKT